MLIAMRIAIALALAAASFSAVSADVPGIDAYFDAHSKFDQMVTALSSNSPPTMPRVAMPSAASVITIMSDSERFLVKPKFGLDHLGTLMDVCDKANRAVMAYMLFELKSHVDISADPTAVARQVAATVDLNAHTFQTELELLQPFSVRCLAQAVPLMTEFTSKLAPEELTDIRRAGLQQFRMGIFGVILGFIQASSDKSLTQSYRTAVLHAVAENSAQFSSALLVANRQQILALATATQDPAPSSAGGDLLAIITAMSDTNCTGLCNY